MPHNHTLKIVIFYIVDKGITCKDGYKFLQNQFTCYKLVTKGTSVTWQQAQTDCQSTTYSNLATVPFETTMEAVKGRINKTYQYFKLFHMIETCLFTMLKPLKAQSGIGHRN